MLRPEERNKEKLVYLKILFVVLLPLLGSSMYFGIYILVAFWALLGPRRALESLTFSWFLTMCNPGIYEIPEGTAGIRWVVIAFSALSIYWAHFRRGEKFPSAYYGVLLFTIAVAVTSVLSSYDLSVSVAKLVIFFVSISSLILLLRTALIPEGYLRQWFLGLFSVVVMIGLPLIGMNAGYLRNDSGFQGLLNHPQAYGVILAPFIAWLLGLLISRRIGVKYWAVCIVAFYSLWLSKSRTGLFALVIGLTVAAVWKMLVDLQRRSSFWSRVAKHAPVLLLFATVALGFSSTLPAITRSFIEKGWDTGSIADTYEFSRGKLMERSLSNFYSNKISGIGFGLASERDSMNVLRDPVFGIPIGAAVEKGMAVTALLEENGIVGAAAFLVFLWLILVPVLGRTSDIPSVALGLSAIAINFGESIIFSPGGTGIMMWLLLLGSGSASAIGVKRRHSARRKVTS